MTTIIDRPRNGQVPVTSHPTTSLRHTPTAQLEFARETKGSPPMSTTPPAANGLTATDQLVRWLSWLLLIVGTVVSARLNAMHAERVGDTMAYHVAIPITALSAGLYAELILMSTHPRVVRWTAGSAVIIGFVFAMASSYTSILAVMRGDMAGADPWMQYGVAAMPDAVMIIAVSVLVSHRWRSTRAHTEQRPPKRPQSALRRSLGGLSVDTVERLRTRVNTPPPASATSSMEAPWSTHGGSIFTPTEPPRGVPTTSVEPAVEPPPSSVASPVAEAKPSAPESVSPAVEAFLPVGEWMVTEEVVARKTAVELASIVEAISRGLTDNRIKTELGYSAGTADKVRSAWIRYQRLNGERPHLVTAGG